MGAVSVDGEDLEVIDPEPDSASDPPAPSPGSSDGRRRRSATVIIVGVALLATGAFGGTALVHRAHDRRARTSETIVLGNATVVTGSAPQSTSPLSLNPDAQFVRQMAIVAPRVGWALTGLALYRTVDDMAHWTNITPPGVEDPLAHIRGVDFLDADHAWLAVELDNDQSTIVRTANAGRTWQALRPNLCRSPSASTAAPCGPLVALDFVDHARGRALVSSNDTSGTLLASSDGGSSWTVVAPTPFAGGVHFADPVNGWGSGRRGELYRTTDGGKTWRTVTIPEGAAGATTSPIGTAQFFGRDGVVAARLALTLSGRPTLAVYESHDGGSTWTTRSAPADPEVNVVNDIDYRFSAAGPSDWALLFGTHVFLTHDAGRHWSTLTPTTGPLGDIDLGSSSSAWMLAAAPTCTTADDDCGNTLLWHTRDGGETWNPESPTIGITAEHLP
jgi:photosystem II stability/assembly factor-like uncharacterized protein